MGVKSTLSTQITRQHEKSFYIQTFKEVARNPRAFMFETAMAAVIGGTAYVALEPVVCFPGQSRVLAFANDPAGTLKGWFGDEASVESVHREGNPFPPPQGEDPVLAAKEPAL